MQQEELLKQQRHIQQHTIKQYMDHFSPSFHYGAARDPNNVEAQEALRRAAEDLRNATNALANDTLKKKLI